MPGHGGGVKGPPLRLPPALAAQLAGALPSLADEVLAAIAAEGAGVRPTAGGSVRRGGCAAGVQLALGQFLSPTGQSAQTGSGRQAYVELGRGEARAGRPLDALLAAYRTGARGRLVAAGRRRAGPGPARARPGAAGRRGVRLHRRAVGGQRRRLHR